MNRQHGYLSTHVLVLLCLERFPGTPQREVATLVGVTERRVQECIADLLADHLLVPTSAGQGRIKRYQVVRDRSLPHPLLAHRTVGELLAFLDGDGAPSPRSVLVARLPD